jgi:hypothetical protein
MLSRKGLGEPSAWARLEANQHPDPLKTQNKNTQIQLEHKRRINEQHNQNTQTDFSIET